MLCLFLTMLAAPVPIGPTVAAPAPKVVELVADADGKVRLLVTRSETVKVNFTYNELVDGVQTTKVGTREQQVPVSKRVLLSEIKDLKIATADGKDVDRPAVLKKLEEGGAVVVVSADGKPIAPKFLKLLRDDAIVLTAEELAAPKPTPALENGTDRPVLRPRAVPAPPIAPPAPPPPPGPIVAGPAVPEVNKEQPPPR